MTADDYVSLIGTPCYPLGHPKLSRTWRSGKGRGVGEGSAKDAGPGK